MKSFRGFCMKMIACHNNSRGQTIIEYCLIIVLIAVLVMAMMTGLGVNSNRALSTINSTLS